MEKDNSSVPRSFTDIRFNIYYVILLFIVSFIMIGIFLTVKEKSWYDDFFLILPILFLVHGIVVLTGSKYIRLDKQSKTIKIYGPFGFAARNYSYDRLFFKDNELYREIDGKTKFLNIVRYQCSKDDLEAFIAEVNKGV